jgi:hypothetical protein
MAESSEKKEGIKIKVSPWAISTLILLVILAILLAYPSITGRVVSNNNNGVGITNKMSANDAANKSIDYINNYLLGGQGTATLVSVNEKNGLYNVKLSIADRQYDSYVTTDGTLFFPSGIDISKTPETVTTTTVPQKTCADITKADKPLLETFIVSNCPYGLQMQRILAPIANILGNYIKVEYIGSISNGKITSMHGDSEATENLRQICIREEQSTKYWDYVNCYIKVGNSDTCLTSAGIDKTKLSTCMTDPKKGLAYAQQDFDLQNKYGVSGSPTLILNGEKVSEFDFGGRSADAVKTLLCCGFNTEPSVCSQNLSTDQAATSFSETYSSASSASTASSGGCAT